MLSIDFGLVSWVPASRYSHRICGCRAGGVTSSVVMCLRFEIRSLSAFTSAISRFQLMSLCRFELLDGWSLVDVNVCANTTPLSSFVTEAQLDGLLVVVPVALVMR